MKLALLSLVIILLAACGPETQEQDVATDRSPSELINQIEEKEEAFRETEDPAERKEQANVLIEILKEFAENHPEHEKTPAYLERAGNLSAHEARDYTQAIGFFEQIYKNHPENDRAPDAKFTVAYLYDTALEKTDKAEKTYRDFIEEHPDHKLAEDAEFAIDFIDKDPDEIMESFRENER